MKQKLKMIWRILRDRQVVVITEDHGRMYYNGIQGVLKMLVKCVSKYTIWFIC